MCVGPLGFTAGLGWEEAVKVPSDVCRGSGRVGFGPTECPACRLSHLKYTL